MLFRLVCAKPMKEIRILSFDWNQDASRPVSGVKNLEISVEQGSAGFAIRSACEVNVADQGSKKSEHFVHLPDIKQLEEEIKSEFYELRNGKVWFSEEIKREHRRLKTRLIPYLLHSRFLAVLTAPFIYALIIPFSLLDLFVSTYQAICFPVYGIPKVPRRDYIAIDRAKLRYLNALEALNCMYCSYANGLLAYVVEIAGRTEQHWCPIRHSRRVRHPHDRYSHFLPYGDASTYREQIEKVRCDFNDIKNR
jgi:hypothetical protein